jgi:hypothetical protein
VRLDLRAHGVGRQVDLAGPGDGAECDVDRSEVLGVG